MPTASRKINIDRLLETHFAEDRANFSKMNERSDKMEKMFVEIKNDLGTLTACQKMHVEESILFREKVSATLEQIKQHTAPVIKDFEDSQTTRRVIQDKGATLIKVSSILVGLGVIVAFLKKIFNI